MAVHEERKAQVELPAKMSSCVDSIPLPFEINGRNRSIGSNRVASRENSRWDHRRTSDGQQQSKLPTQPASAPVANKPA